MAATKKPLGFCDTCKTEVASGTNAASVADALKRHKKKTHALFAKRKSA